MSLAIVLTFDVLLEMASNISHYFKAKKLIFTFLSPKNTINVFG
jgi:hypothetical protein